MILTLKDFLRIFKHVCSSESKMEQTFIKLKEDKRKDYVEIDSLDLEDILEELTK